jgi:hypothetical protein
VVIFFTIQRNSRERIGILTEMKNGRSGNSKASKAVQTGSSRTSARPKPTRDHWSHPAGYRVGGTKLASLAEVADPLVPTMSLSELTEQQRIDLAVARLQAKADDFRMIMVGPGLINKARAIAEVQARTKVGRTIMEIEQLLIEALATGIPRN